MGLLPYLEFFGFFKHDRQVAHRDGTSSMKFAPLRKTIYSLKVMRERMHASNRRYLDFLSQLRANSTAFHAMSV
jgi:hypothetical protein